MARKQLIARNSFQQELPFLDALQPDIEDRQPVPQRPVEDRPADRKRLLEENRVGQKGWDRLIPLQGKVFGKLTVLSKVPRPEGARQGA